MSSLIQKPVDLLPRQKYPLERPPYHKARRKGVTVCIACICERSKAIVAVCDSKLSSGFDSSDEATLKAVRVSANWGFMYATASVSPLVPIRQRLRQELKATPNELQNVVSVFQAIFREQVLAKARDLNQIPQETSLGVDLMAFGYDDQPNPHIFTVSDLQGKIDFQDILGFQTIGTGGQTASSVLYFFGQNTQTPLALTIYHACAAKFMAESASDVGEHTSVLVFTPEGKAVLFYKLQIDSIRAMWERDGKPRVPANAEGDVSKLLAQAEAQRGIIEQILEKSYWSDERD